MASDLEEQKKAILPFMQRAQEIQQADPKVAYYCRMYAVEQAIKLPNRAKEITALLSATLNQLERDKAQLKLDPIADRIHCLGFALRIFDNADRVDRAGRATERTSRAFYAASVFIEILNQFEGGVDAELVEKQRYCAWRAAEIRKAIREGRQPTPPPSISAASASGDITHGSSSSSTPPVNELPPASGSSDWAYSGQSQSHALPTPMPPLLGTSDGCFSGTSNLSFVSAADQSFTGKTFNTFNSDVTDSFRLPSMPALHERAPPPSVSSCFGAADAALEATVASRSAAMSSSTRLWPGARVLLCVEEGLGDGTADADGTGKDTGHPPGTQVGTVGQVIRLPDGSCSYKVALADRLVEVPDKAAVPLLQEGGVACLRALSGQQQQPSVVKVLLINYASWPPTYMVQTPDGKEHAVTAQELGPVSLGDDSAMTPSLHSGFQAHPLPPHPKQQAQLHPSPPQAALPAAPSAPPFPGPSSPWPHSSVAGAHPPPPPPAGYQHSYPSANATPAAASLPYMAPPSLPQGYKPSLQVITDAQKQAKYAVSALSFEDVHTAVKHLSEALRLLTSPPGSHQGPGRR